MLDFLDMSVQKALATHDGMTALHIYKPWYATRTVALGGAVPERTISVEARSLWDEMVGHPYDGVVLDVEGAEHVLLCSVFPQHVRWIVAELHGSPKRLAAALAAPAPAFRLDAIEAHFTYLVAGWVRS